MKKLINILLITFILLSLFGCSKKLTVTFDSENGTDAVLVEVKNKAKIAKPEDPKKEGYKFDGWTLNGAKFDFEQAITDNIVLKAKYTKIFKVTLDCNNGTENQVIEVLDGEKLAKPEDPKKEGYVFKGWKVGDKEYDFSTTVNKDLEIEAIWGEYVEIKGLSFSSTSMKLAKGSSKKLPVTVDPSNGTGITYSSSHSDVVSVDEEGTIICLKKGSSTIIATSSNGKTASYDVEVFVPVKSISLTVDRTTISYDGVKDAIFTAIISPADADITSVSWNASGDIGGQNGSYSFTSNGNSATLTARDNSRYNQNSSVTAYVINADGSKIESNKVSIYAEKKLTITNYTSNSTWKYENGKYMGNFAHGANFRIVTSEESTFTYDSNPDYIWQEHVEEFELWLTLANEHSHPEGFQIKVTSDGGQEATCVITISNKKFYLLSIRILREPILGSFNCPKDN